MFCSVSPSYSIYYPSAKQSARRVNQTGRNQVQIAIKSLPKEPEGPSACGLVGESSRNRPVPTARRAALSVKAAQTHSCFGLIDLFCFCINLFRMDLSGSSRRACLGGLYGFKLSGYFHTFKLVQLFVSGHYMIVLMVNLFNKLLRNIFY